MVSGKGRRHELSVQIGPQDHHVECHDIPAPSYSSCRSVLDAMQWTAIPERFGVGGDIPLPYRFSSGEQLLPLNSLD